LMSLQESGSWGLVLVEDPEVRAGFLHIALAKAFAFAAPLAFSFQYLRRDSQEFLRQQSASQS
jgi:hypothetical protein